jgi:hypothetical protein
MCVLSLFQGINNSSFNLAVYRVNWLRAKARHDRWEEEVILVTKEMGWTVNWFNHYATRWRLRAQNVDAKGGAAAYAWKQAQVWESLKKDCEVMFGVGRSEPYLQ